VWRAPALFLITRPPARDVMGLRFDAGHRALDQVRRLDDDASFREDLQTLQRRVVEAFLGTARGGGIAVIELLHQRP
jgi:hypothetical protein